MINALTTAAAGLKQAATRVDAAATKIVRAGAQASNDINGTGPLTPPTPGTPIQTGPVLGDDLLTGIIDLKQAELSYKANAKVIASLDELEDSLLDILS